MKILLSLFFGFSFAHASCGFRPEFPKVYSLSGPVSRILEELKILDKVRGISVFYPAPRNYSGEIIAGGISLSPVKLRAWKDALVFYDKSQGIQKALSSQNITSVEVAVRNLTPRETVEEGLRVLKPYLTGCDLKVPLDVVSKSEEEIRKHMKKNEKIIFFLGEVYEGKLPELVIAEDGLVLWLKRESLIETYPSELAYVNWSGAIIERLKRDFLFLGLKEGKSPGIVGKGQRQTLIYPGGLIPGLHQLEAWKFFLDQRRR